MKMKWKRAFWLLLSSLLVGCIIIGWLIFSPAQEHSYQPSDIPENHYYPITVDAKKSSVNGLIEKYIREKELDGPIEYKVVLNQQVGLIGSIEVFDQEIDLFMTFTPTVTENGDIILTEETMQLGQLSVPSSRVLKFVRDHYNLPSWVSIMPEQNRIFVALTKLQLQNGTRLKAIKFDLENDDLKLELFVPKNEKAT